MASLSRRNILFIGIAFLLISPIVLLIFFGWGQVEGDEFSPDDFSRRSFSYNQAPIFGWPIRKKSYIDTTTPLEKELIADKLITPTVNPKKTWHLTNDSGSGNGMMPVECDARFLTDYLDQRNDEGDYFWSTWNSRFPEPAKIYWPLVADLARDQMYLKVSDVMEFAKKLDQLNDDEAKNIDVAQFETELKTMIAKAYLELGEIDLELERFKQAKFRLEKSDEIQPSQKAKDLLAKCLPNLQAEANEPAEKVGVDK